MNISSSIQRFKRLSFVLFLLLLCSFNLHAQVCPASEKTFSDLDSQLMNFFLSSGLPKYKEYKKLVLSNDYGQTFLLSDQIRVIHSKNPTAREQRLLEELTIFSEMNYFSPLKQRIQKNNLHINIVITHLQRHPITGLPISGLNSLIRQSSNASMKAEGLIILGVNQKLDYKPIKQVLSDGSVQFSLPKISPMIVFLNEMNELVDAQEFGKELVSTVEYQSASAAIDMTWALVIIKFHRKINSQTNFTVLNAEQRDDFLKKGVSLISESQLTHSLNETKDSVTGVYKTMESELDDGKKAKLTAWVLNRRLREYFGPLASKVKFVPKRTVDGLYLLEPLSNIES